ncbi:MAG: hypothetical protein IKJ88_05055 [Clostridia bacterium]|nr:hypothetical protein [Clostridia bacterium]
MGKGLPKEKIGAFFSEVKTHWKTPAEGKYVSYKEYLYIFLGIGSNYTGSKILENIGFWASCYLFMHHYKLPYLTFSIIGIINMPLNYIWTLIGWVINDNLGFLSKKTERKLYALYTSLIVIGLVMIFGKFDFLSNSTNAFIVYLNNMESIGINAASALKILGTHILWNGWAGARNIFYRKKLVPKYGRYKYSLYCDVIPKCIMVILVGWLPLYEIPDMVTRVWAANLLFACFNIFGFGNNLETCSKSISPNMQERLLVRTYPVKLSHFVHTIVSILILVVVDSLEYEWADINLYRWVYPLAFIIPAALTMVFAGKFQERIPQPPLEKKVQIKFWDGIFGVLRNKYLRINTIVGLIDALGNGMLAITTILYLYTFRLAGLPYAIIINLISFAGTPPDLCAPFFLKRFDYKQIMIFYQLTRALGNALIVLAFMFCGDNLMLCGTISIIVMFFMEMTKTIPTTAGHEMGTRMGDYQMYLSGERLESFSGIFGWFTGPVTSFVGLIIPIFLLKFGFNSNWDVLYLDEARVKIIAVPLIIDIVGYLLMTIPYIFWDYDNVKQAKVMKVLQRRAEVTAKQAQEQGEKISGGFTK